MVSGAALGRQMQMPHMQKNSGNNNILSAHVSTVATRCGLNCPCYNTHTAASHVETANHAVITDEDGASPARLHSPASGSSSSDAAMAPQGPPRPGAQRASGDRWLLQRQNGRRLRHRQQSGSDRRARVQGIQSDGACRAPPALVTGLTMLASTACCKPCHSTTPFATTPMRRSSATGTSMFMSGKRTLRATLFGRPSQQPVQKSPVRGATGSGKRSRRSIRTRNTGEVTVSSDEVGKTVKARAACGSACDSSRHRGEKDATRISVASERCCQPAESRQSRGLLARVAAAPVAACCSEAHREGRRLPDGQLPGRSSLSRGL